ncbi:META domain-containing protein [Hyphomonadaceae bacterium ML37]|nr:META domain-containing protein [Hyphomonadaceae bacterium ML37]
MFRALALAFAASLLTAACSEMFDDNGAAPSTDGEPASTEPASDDPIDAAAAEPAPVDFDSDGRATPGEAGGPITDEYLALLPLRGYGHEPNWHVLVERDSTTIYRQTEALISFPTRQPDVVPARFRFEDPDSESHVVFRRDICRDIATGMPHPFTVIARPRPDTFEGCGGDPETLFADANWTLAMLGGDALDSDRELSIRFEDGRVSGSGGCNRFMGGYTLTGEALTLSELASTQMACPDEAMNQETRLLEQLSQVTMFDLTDEGALVLRTAGGDTITAYRTE